MKLLRRVYYVLIFTNILIAVAAAAQCALTYLIFDQPYNLYIILIEGSATLLLYNFSFALSKPTSPADSKYARTRWVFRHEWLLWLDMIIAASVLTYALFHVHLYTWLFLGIIGMVSILYSFPIIPYQGKWVGLRQLPALKVFHIALVWTLSSVALPTVELWAQGVAVEGVLFYSLFAFKFLFLVICTLPFDIRDIAQDSYYHLRTIPSMLGVEKAIRLCYILVALHSLLVVFSSVMPGPIKGGILATNFLIAIFYRFFIFEKKGHYHYTYLLDLALVLQFLFVLLSVVLFQACGG